MIGDVLVSGIDEQHIVPNCPICKDEVDFWILYTTIDGSGMNGWYWLHSDNYRKKSGYDKLVCMKSFDGVAPILDKIVVVCHTTLHGLHRFTAESPTFQRVIQVARRLEK